MEIIAKGVLNRGDAGGRRALSTFPIIVALSDGTLLAAYRVGTTKDSEDETIELRRSADDGRTWSAPVTPFASTLGGRKGSLKLAYITRMDAEHLMVAAMWVDREAYPGMPLFNEDSEGCLPMTVLVADSYDQGFTWSPWRAVPVPDDVGPASLTSPILRLPSGRLALSIETNKNYEDRSPWFQRVVYVCSGDRGKTWEPPITVAHDPTRRIFNWDQRAGVAADGRLLTFTWYYDRETSSYLNIRRRLSSDEGRTWTLPEELDIADQPSHPAILPDGRVVLAWVDRYQTRSIRAGMALDIDAPFLPETEVVLYTFPTSAQGKSPKVSNTGEMLVEQGLWSFGLPYTEALADGSIMVVYYAGSIDCTDIHWVRLSLKTSIDAQMAQ